MKKSKNYGAVPGDKVSVEYLHKSYTGILLEVPISEKDVVLLKLDTGYNIGLPKKELKGINVLKKSEDKEEKIDLKRSKDKPSIAMVITGGTIAARLDAKTGGVSWLDSPESLLKYYPGIFEIANVSKVEVPFMKASEDMDYRDWQKIAKVVERLLNDSNIKGVIVTHGTDFLHYTAAALSFFLDVKKPVVLTYSQRSIDRASSDANLNLQCAAVAAISDVAEVMLVGHATSSDDYCYALPGTKVRKMHSSMRDAFKVVNDKPYAKIFGSGLLSEESHSPTATPRPPTPTSRATNQYQNRSEMRIDILREHKTRSKGKTKRDDKFEEKVALVKVYPGADSLILDFYAKQKYRGIVLELSGLGHAPSKNSRKQWTKKIKKLVKKGIVVVGTTQCIFGRVDPYVYSNGREMIDAGVLYVGDMLAETAFVKLGWVLGHKGWNVKSKMLENVSGEINERLGFEGK
jgi:glutamyl-tRNA(Gln) amidotransferase subunit D